MLTGKLKSHPANTLQLAGTDEGSACAGRYLIDEVWTGYHLSINVWTSPRFIDNKLASRSVSWKISGAME